MAAGGAARRSPTCSAIMVPWLKPTSASADGGSFRRASSASRKCSSTGPALLTPVPALVRRAGEQRKPLPPGRRLAARLGRMRRDERGVRQQPLPGPADVDQVVAVGAIAVQEHDEALGRCPPGGSSRGPSSSPAIGCSIFLLGFFFGFLLFRHGRPCGLHRRALAPLHHVIVGPQQMRGHPAPRPPGFGRASPSPWRRAASGDRRRAAPPPARRDRRPARHRRCRGRTADRCRRSTARCRAARSAPRAPGRPPSRRQRRGRCASWRSPCRSP